MVLTVSCVAWKCISPLLDARTVAKVQWLGSGSEIRGVLAKSFVNDNLPQWLGGEAENKPLELYMGVKLDAEECRKSLFA